MTDDVNSPTAAPQPALGRDFVVVVCRPAQVKDAKEYWRDHGQMDLLFEHDDKGDSVRAFLDRTTSASEPVIDKFDRRVLVFATRQVAVTNDASSG